MSSDLAQYIELALLVIIALMNIGKWTGQRENDGVTVGRRVDALEKRADETEQAVATTITHLPRDYVPRPELEAKFEESKRDRANLWDQIGWLRRAIEQHHGGQR